MPDTQQPSSPSSPSRPATHASAQPRGLYTLFFTEMWERFSFYGMRGLLVLFMVHKVQDGGLGMSDEIATAIYGLYTAGVYLSALPGGWLADRLFGAQRSIWYGGILIAIGHFTLAIPSTMTFYLGLVFVVLGTGLLKPNISALVGELYPEGGPRRDAGFSIFYMGINLGAFIGPLICSALGEKVNWHYGFGAAGVGMVAGLIQFHLTRRHLGNAGLRPERDAGLSRNERVLLACAGAGLVALVGLSLTGILHFNPVTLARTMTKLIVAVAVLYFAYVLLFLDLNKQEKQRIGVIIILIFGAALFWAGFEQAGSTFNLFADRYTVRYIDVLHREIPAGYFQSIGPVFIIIFAPVMASLWLALARRKLSPSLPIKFGLGLVLLAVGFLIMASAAKLVAAGHKVWPTWLISTYLVHTFGELCLSPVGLSSVTKLAPRRLVGQMMGTWFLASALGNLIAGLLAGQFKADAVGEMPGLYLKITIIPTITGAALILLARPIRKWMAGVD